MKTKVFLLSISIFIAQLSLKAQSVEKDITNLSCKAYLMNSDIFWNEAIQKSRSLAEENKHDIHTQLIYINTLYGTLNSSLADKDKEVYNIYLNETEKAIDQFIEANPDNAHILCIKSGLYGVKMAYNPWKGMFFGPKSAELISKAMKLDPELPQVWIRQASSEFFTPEAYGGNIWKSMETYQKAIDKFETYEENLTMNWEYLDALAWLGISQMKNQQYAESKATFEKVLGIQPNFPWVKHVLLPEAISLAENSNKASEF